MQTAGTKTRRRRRRRRRREPAAACPLLLSRGRGSSSWSPCGLLLPIGHCFVLLPHSSLHQSQSVSCVLSTPSHDGPTRRSAHAAVRVPRSRQKEKAAAACVAVRAPATKPTTTPRAEAYACSPRKQWGLDFPVPRFLGTCVGKHLLLLRQTHGVGPTMMTVGF